MLPLIADQGLAFIAYSPLAGGWLTGKYKRDQPSPSGSRMTLRPGPYEGLKTPETYRAIEALAAMATEFGTSAGALALSWACSHPAVTAALVGPRNLEQLELVEDALDVTLTPGDRKRILDRMETGAEAVPT